MRYLSELSAINVAVSIAPSGIEITRQSTLATSETLVSIAPSGIEIQAALVVIRRFYAGINRTFGY
ncbi:hypothetical protein BN8_05926 [Fibrisoma limi BUZ 3]|uniref:Uncharacterized protein n=1 Tax=Fibrisoma limi BUZ 3 TaxID=1185876 RepID=I2GRP0_9BACT|nr:hypothetical protein BN8_05926 [Fibrisoma limi BUZ 3]